MTATFSLNQAHNGVEIHFTAKPEQTIIDTLKQNRFRWHSRKKLWYNKQTPESIAIAESIATMAIIPAGIPQPVVNIHGVKVGDIFYTSWGYEQTNIDFYEVVRVTEKTAHIRELKQSRTDTSFMQGVCEPIPGSYSTERINKSRTDNWSGQPLLKNADGNNHSGYMYDGTPKRFSSYA